MKLYSQNNEQEFLIYLFKTIGTTNEIAVEIGAGNGYYLSNIRHFMENGWTGYQFDKKYPHAPQVKKATVTAENINRIFNRNFIPHRFDLLSIDIDGNDYWVWKSLNRLPRVVVIEFNKWVRGAKAIKYDPKFKIDVNVPYYGASFQAMKLLGNEKGYKLIGHNNINMFFCNDYYKKVPLKMPVVREPTPAINLEAGEMKGWVNV